MKKEALEVLENRRSIRSYTDEAVDPALLDIILRAGTYAPTAKNRMDPVIVAVTDKETTDILRRMNAEAWGQTGKDPYYGAPVILIVFSTDTFTGRLDAAAVMTNMLNAAYAVDLAACWINRPYEMFQAEEGKALMAKWGVPEGCIGVCSMALGHSAVPQPKASPRKEGYILRV